MASSKLGATAARTTAMLEGSCVNAMVLRSPMRRASQAATGKDKAASTPDQKKKRPALARDRPNLLKSHSASSDWTRKPPAKASMLKSAASLQMMGREGPSAPARSAIGLGGRERAGDWR